MHHGNERPWHTKQNSNSSKCRTACLFCQAPRNVGWCCPLVSLQTKATGVPSKKTRQECSDWVRQSMFWTRSMRVSALLGRRPYSVPVASTCQVRVRCPSCPKDHVTVCWWCGLDRWFGFFEPGLVERVNGQLLNVRATNPSTAIRGKLKNKPVVENQPCGTVDGQNPPPVVKDGSL